MNYEQSGVNHEITALILEVKALKNLLLQDNVVTQEQIDTHYLFELSQAINSLNSFEQHPEKEALRNFLNSEISNIQDKKNE